MPAINTATDTAITGLVVIQGIKPLGRECSCYAKKQKKFQHFQQSKKREYRNSISYYFIYTFPYPLSVGNHFQHFPTFPTNAPATKKPGIAPGSKAFIHPMVSYRNELPAWSLNISAFRT